MNKAFTAILAATFFATLTIEAAAEKNYAPGVSDTEIKIGQTMPYSGPASALGTAGRAHAAYLKMINDKGGINGRKIRLISLDDAYNPAKTVEQTRRLVEQDGVALIFGSLGTAPNMAIHKYVNAKKLPHLFIASSSSRWNDPTNFPWTMMTIRPSFEMEGRGYAKYILRTRPNGKIGVLYQNDEQGKDYLRGLREGLGSRADEFLVSEQSYELTDTTVDSQIVTLKASGADVLLNFSTPKFGAQAIRKSYDIAWKPLHVVAFTASAIKPVLQPAGLEKSIGLISSSVTKDPSDPQWRNNPAIADYLAWMKSYYPDGDPDDWSNVAGYTTAQMLVHVLKSCEDDLSRENIMRQAASMTNLELPMLLPGIRVNTSPTDYLPVEQFQFVQFDGKRWVRIGEVVGK
ncbi:MAG: ABC transporter substrate-binding protein [Burkholderiales bacterium]